MPRSKEHGKAASKPVTGSSARASTPTAALKPCGRETSGESPRKKRREDDSVNTPPSLPSASVDKPLEVSTVLDPASTAAGDSDSDHDSDKNSQADECNQPLSESQECKEAIEIEREMEQYAVEEAARDYVNSDVSSIVEIDKDDQV